MNNLFHNLSKYKPQEGRNPLEDFLTEAFAFLLNYYVDAEGTAMTNHLLTKIVNIASESDENHELMEKISKERYHVDTQRDLDEHGRVDMVVEGYETCFYFENKIKAPLGENQIKGYKESWTNSNKKGNGGVVLLTDYYAENMNRDNKPDFKFQWTDVHLFLIEFSRSPRKDLLKKDNRFLFDQFKEFLEVNDIVIKRITNKFEWAIRERWNIIQLLPRVMDTLKNEFPNQKKSFAHTWNGFWFGRNSSEEFWFGILDKRGSLTLEIRIDEGIRKKVLKKLKRENEHWYLRYEYIAYDFGLETCPEFENMIEVMDQIECLAKFVQDRVKRFRKFFSIL